MTCLVLGRCIRFAWPRLGRPQLCQRGLQSCRQFTQPRQLLLERVGPAALHSSLALRCSGGCLGVLPLLAKGIAGALQGCQLAAHVLGFLASAIDFAVGPIL